jgi:hypothetical protein
MLQTHSHRDDKRKHNYQCNQQKDSSFLSGSVFENLMMASYTKVFSGYNLLNSFKCSQETVHARNTVSANIGYVKSFLRLKVTVALDEFAAFTFRV